MRVFKLLVNWSSCDWVHVDLGELVQQSHHSSEGSQLPPVSWVFAAEKKSNSPYCRFTVLALPEGYSLHLRSLPLWPHSLQVLDLSFNSLAAIEGLDDLPIEELGLEGNDLSSLEGLSRLPFLTTLNVSKNNISSLAPLKTSASLTTLIAQDNKISIIRQVEFLVELPWLRVVELTGNPCCFKPFFRYCNSLIMHDVFVIVVCQGESFV